MTPLRRKMIDAMIMKGFAANTQEAYLRAMIQLVRHYRRSPDTLDRDQIQAYLLYLIKEKHLSPASCRQAMHGILFFYLHVLQRPLDDLTLDYPKVPQRIPELLSPAEVALIIQSCANLKHRTMLAVCYGAGLRVSELVALKVRDIDSAQGYLRIEQGKGAKDRHALLTPCLLKQLRHYWLKYRPQSILFYSADDRATALTSNAIQRVYRAAKNKAGIEKIGGIHSLRHAFATHQLAAGVPLHELQHLLGHQNIHSTQRYIHWLPACRPGLGKGCDLLQEVLSDD